MRSVQGDFTVIWLGSTSGAVLISPVGLWLLWNDPQVFAATVATLLCVVGTGVSHAAYMGLLARAYERGEISVVYPIARGTGVGVTAIAAVILLDEPLSGIGGLGILLVILGVLMYRSAARQWPRDDTRNWSRNRHWSVDCHLHCD